MAKMQVTSEQLLQMAILAMLDEGKKASEIAGICQKQVAEVWHAWQQDKRERDAT